MKRTGRRTQFSKNDAITLTDKGDVEVRMLYLLAMAIKTEAIYEMPQSLIDGFAVPSIRKVLKECETVEDQIDFLIVATAFIPAFSAGWGATLDEQRTLAAQVAKYLTCGELPNPAPTTAGQ